MSDIDVKTVVGSLERISQILSSLENRMSNIEGTESPTLSKGFNNKLVDKYHRLDQQLITEIQDCGILNPLLENPSINDILINGSREIYIERNGKLQKTDLKFNNDDEIIKIANDIVETVGRKLDPRRPLVDARLIDGSRVNVIAPPLAVDGTTISIRKFSDRKLDLHQMVTQGNMSNMLAEFLHIAAACKMNILISGGTGAGKTTLLNAVSEGIDEDERIVTIEDAAELRLTQPHVVRLETKPLQLGQREEEAVTIRDLVKNALRMRPDRIIVGEVRGAEAFDMMQAMNTGHEGSMSTIHANHPRDALSRLENMISMANLGLPSSAIRYQIASAINLVVQISRMRDGHRRISYVSEIVGMEGDIITMQDLFSFQASNSASADGTVDGKFVWSGIVPRTIRRINYYGLKDRLGEALGVDLPDY